jgi:hypothetical protein
MWLTPLLLASAFAGDLTLDLTFDDQTHHLQFDDMATCQPTEVQIEGPTRLRVAARVTAQDSGALLISVDLEAESGRRRRARVVHLTPKILVKPGEPASITVTGPQGTTTVDVVAKGFEGETPCHGPSRARERF